MNVAGRTVLLTGATGGLGEAIARALAERDAKLVVSGRRTDVLEPLAAELGARALPCDLADRQALDDLLAQVGDVDVLVANAALPADGPIADYTPEQIDRALDVNLRAPILMAKALSAGMATRGEGHLVFMSSLSGKVATAGSALYSATKFGLRGFAASMREDLREKGVGVSAIFPGFIGEAGMFAQAEVTLRRGVGTRKPRDVARAVVRAIERNRAEFDVAPLPMRWGAAAAGVAPSAVAALNRRLGAAELADQIAGSEAHRGKR